MDIINREAELVAVDELKTHPRNPRRGNLDAVIASIRENGFYGTVVAQQSTNHVLVGNHRLLAARQLEAEEIPVIWVDVDDERALRIMLADNRASDLGRYETNVLDELLQELNETETGLEGTGYSLEDVDPTAGLSADPVEIEERWAVMVELDNEAEQLAVIELLEEEGYTCRGIIM